MNLNELKAEIIRKGYTLEEFAEEMGMVRTTLSRRFNRPEHFKLSEIYTIINLLELKEQKIKDIFFNEEVS